MTATLNDTLKIKRNNQGIGMLIDSCTAKVVKDNGNGKVVCERIDNGFAFALNLNVAEKFGLTVEKIF